MPEVLSALESVATSRSVSLWKFDCNYVLYNNHVLYHMQYMYTDLQVLYNVFQVMMSQLLSQVNRVLKKMISQRF